MKGKDLGKVLGRYFSFEKPESSRCPCLEVLRFVLKINDRDMFKRYSDVPEQDWKRAFGDRTIPDN